MTMMAAMKIQENSDIATVSIKRDPEGVLKVSHRSCLVFEDKFSPSPVVGLSVVNL